MYILMWLFLVTQWLEDPFYSGLALGVLIGFIAAMLMFILCTRDHSHGETHGKKQKGDD